jgi:hypothetical protein
MRYEILMVLLLLAAVMVSGCTQQPAGDQQPDDGLQPPQDLGASAYELMEQEMDQALDDIDLSDMENELLV